MGDICISHGHSQLSILPWLVALPRTIIKLGAYSHHITTAIVVGWTSRNSNSVGARSVSAALYNVRNLIQCYVFFFTLPNIYLRTLTDVCPSWGYRRLFRLSRGRQTQVSSRKYQPTNYKHCGNFHIPRCESVLCLPKQETRSCLEYDD